MVTLQKLSRAGYSWRVSCQVPLLAVALLAALKPITSVIATLDTPGNQATTSSLLAPLSRFWLGANFSVLTGLHFRKRREHVWNEFLHGWQRVVFAFHKQNRNRERCVLLKL